MAGEEVLTGATRVGDRSGLEQQLADALARYDALPVDREELIQRHDQIEGEIDALAGQLGISDPLAGSSGVPQDIPGELDVTDYPAPLETPTLPTSFGAEPLLEWGIEKTVDPVVHFGKVVKAVYDMDSGERRQLLDILLSDAQPAPAAGESEDDPLVEGMSVDEPTPYDPMSERAADIEATGLQEPIGDLPPRHSREGRPGEGE